MELSQLRYFAAVARLGNISRAARELYVTQPNLSKSIARLEEELGVPLFEHRKGKIVLNDYGRCFLASVNLSLGELENGVRSIQRMYDATQNILALGVPLMTCCRTYCGILCRSTRRSGFVSSAGALRSWRSAWGSMSWI